MTFLPCLSEINQSIIRYISNFLKRGCSVMQGIRKYLLQAQHDLKEKYESPSDLIDRLRSEGKSMGEIERAVLKMNRIQGAYDSVETALRMLE